MTNTKSTSIKIFYTQNTLIKGIFMGSNYFQDYNA